MTEPDFSYLSAFLRQRSGLALPSHKRYLAEARLAPVCRLFALSSKADLVRRLKLGCDPDLAHAVVEAMTTNETSFFRDKMPFDVFRTVLLPRLLTANRGTKQIRIWCAAASSGQEPYSLAMILRSAGAQLAGWQVDLVATDISAEMVRKAKAGLYSQFEVQRGLPINLLLEHFEQIGEHWRVSDDLRRMVEFRPLNLTEPFGHLGSFDVIFCRNVLIYFDSPTKVDVMERLADVLKPDGAVMLGASETATGLTDALVPEAEHPAIYNRAPGRRRASSLRLVTGRA